MAPRLPAARPPMPRRTPANSGELRRLPGFLVRGEETVGPPCGRPTTTLLRSDTRLRHAQVTRGVAAAGPAAHARLRRPRRYTTAARQGLPQGGGEPSRGHRLPRPGNYCGEVGRSGPDSAIFISPKASSNAPSPTRTKCLGPSAARGITCPRCSDSPETRFALWLAALILSRNSAQSGTVPPR